MDASPFDASSVNAQMRQRELLEKELSVRSLKDTLTPGPDKDKKLREACKGFESIFINKLWQEMRNTVPKDGYLHSKQEEFYLSMFDQEMSNKLAEAGGIGLGDMLYAQLKASSEDASRYTAPSRASDPKAIKPLRGGLDEKQTSALAAQTQSPGPLYTPLEETADKGEGDSQGHENQGETQTAAGTSFAQPLPAAQKGKTAQAPEPPLDAISLRATLSKPAAQRYNPPLGQRSGVAPRTPTTNATAFSPTSQSPRPAATQIPAQAATQPGNAQSVETNPDVLAAVDSLVARITQQPLQAPAAPMGLAQPSAVTATPSRTQLAPPPAVEQLGNPTPITVDPLRKLESGIQNKQGALPNEGGLESTRPSFDPPLLANESDQGFRKGPLTRPVAGDATSNYGWRRSAFTGQMAFHEGVDLAANHGDPVKACWDGKVAFSGEQEGYGKLVILDHGGGWRSYYGHNSGNGVREGDIVRAGMPIARAGSTGTTTGTHVHFELRHNDTAVDPALVEKRFQASLSAQQPG